MSVLKSFQFNQVDWATAATEIMQIRQKVFIIEQHFGKKILSDKHDANCFHILVTDKSSTPVACGRLNLNGQIGHIAVLMDQRREGIGTMLLSKLIRIAQCNRIYNISLNAETELSHFYSLQKFQADGPVYMKQGIPFQRMTKQLAQN